MTDKTFTANCLLSLTTHFYEDSATCGKNKKLRFAVVNGEYEKNERGERIQGQVSETSLLFYFKGKVDLHVYPNSQSVQQQIKHQYTYLKNSPIFLRTDASFPFTLFSNGTFFSNGNFEISFTRFFISSMVAP